MRLEPLYRLRFRYPESGKFRWPVTALLKASTSSSPRAVAAGNRRRSRGADHPRRRSDANLQAEFQGVIEADDGATIFFDLRGYGRAYPIGRRQIVGSATHLSADDTIAGSMMRSGCGRRSPGAAARDR